MRPALQGIASLFFASVLAVSAFAQNPVPQIVGPVHPDAVAPGGGDFTLSVYGANFVPGVVVNWNYQPRATTYVSGHEVQAQILSTDIAKNTAGYITVTNPAPGGGSSSASWAQVEVHDPVSTVVMNQSAYYDFGFWELGAADFNHDGILDLLGEYYGLGLQLGQESGLFRPASTVDRTNLDLTQFGYGDFNGDGNLDVASVSYEELQSHGAPKRMDIMLGDGRGDFSPGPVLMSDWYDFGFVAVGDFNQDGKLDLVTRGENLSTYLGNGDGTFKHVARYSYPAEGLSAGMLAGDFNGDGKLDLILLQLDSSQNETKVWFVEGNGDGTFRTPKKAASFAGTQVCAGSAPSDGLLSDFNGDGKLDLAFCNESQIVVLLGNGDGTFKPPSFYTGDPTGQRQFTFGIGDLNSDGYPDLLVSQYLGDSGFTFTVFFGNGDGSFKPGQLLNLAQTPPAELGITVGDFNNDGLLDFIFQIGTGMEVFEQQ